MKNEYTRKISDGMEPTLYELKSATPGVVYDVFDGEFTAKEGDTQARYRGFVSLKNPSGITIEGSVVDSTGHELQRIAPSGTPMATWFSIEGRLSVSGDALLRLKARYTTASGVVQTPEITIPLAPALPDGSHKLEHPTKRGPDEPVRRYGDRQSAAGMGYQPAPETGYVVTVLNRDPADTRDIDYLCCWGMADIEHPYFGLPGKGSVIGPKNAKFLPRSSLLSATCVLYPRDKKNGGGLLTASANSVRWSANRMKSAFYSDGKQYEITAGDIVFNSSPTKPNVAQYEFLGAWQGHKLVYDEREQRGAFFDYELTLHLPFEIPGASKPAVYTVIVTSRPNTTPASLYDRSVLPIKIMYGCVARGSMVSTPNGEKRIENICIGDLVTTPTGTATVRNTWIGMEREILNIGVRGGHSIRVTLEHPMLTKRGMVRASDILASDQLIMSHGSAEPEQLFILPYDSMVYNLDVDGGAMIVNSFVTGDMSVQNRRL